MGPLLRQAEEDPERPDSQLPCGAAVCLSTSRRRYQNLHRRIRGLKMTLMQTYGSMQPRPGTSAKACVVAASSKKCREELIYIMRQG